MAGAIGGARPASRATAGTRPERALYTLRLALGGAALLGAVTFLLGTSWDIQWHSFVGRDRTLIPPHEVMLGGIALAGAAALASVVVETLWARRDAALAATTTEFAGAFHAPLGAYVAGFGALAAALGFPLDAYWHALYGIDVTIWAPFHVMILMGMATATLGAAYMLRSAGTLAARQGAPAPARAGEAGVVVALAALMSMLLLFLDASFGGTYIGLFGLRINVFPLMLGIFGIFPLAVLVRAVPWRGAASAAAGVYYAFDLLIYLAVPPLTNALVIAEHQSYRRGVPPHEVVVSLVWPLSLILAAVLLDVAVAYARRRGLAGVRADRLLLAAAVVGTVLVPLLDPFYLGRYSLIVRLRPAAAVTAFLLALLLGALGAWAAGWVGLEVGAALRATER